MWYSPRVRVSGVNSVLTEADGSTLGTRSTKQSSYGWAHDQLIRRLIWNLIVHSLLISIQPVISILRNINPGRTFKPLTLGSYLILSTNLWWSLPGFPPQCIICLMNSTCLVHLNLFNRVWRVIEIKQTFGPLWTYACTYVQHLFYCLGSQAPNVPHSQSSIYHRQWRHYA
jgi:hypothetical protein